MVRLKRKVSRELELSCKPIDDVILWQKNEITDRYDESILRFNNGKRSFLVYGRPSDIYHFYHITKVQASLIQLGAEVICE